MGTVLLVADTLAGGRKVAFKSCVLPCGPGESVSRTAAIEATRREFLALAELRHPSLPEVRDFGVVSGRKGSCERCFFTYDFVDGPNIYEWSTNRSPEALAEIARQLLDALSLLHSRGLVHLDVKPPNILVQTSPDGPRAKLIDFGVARHLMDAAPRPAAGTLPYVAPEVLRGESAGPGADLFGLGVTLFQCLFRTLPYDARSAESLRHEHLHRIPAPPAGWNRPGGSLESLIWRLLSHDPARRFDGLSPPGASAIGAYLLANRPTGLEPALGSVLASYEAACRGEPRPAVILIEGDCGSGKTRLLEEAKARVQVLGGRFLLVGQHGSNDSADPIIEALLGLAGRRSRAARAFERKAAWSPIPTPASYVIDRGSEEGIEALRDQATWDLLCAAAGDRPLVLAIDDAHSLGHGPLRLLASLARRLGVRIARAERTDRGRPGPKTPPRILLCATSRPDLTGETLRSFHAVRASRACRRVVLRSLSLRNVRAILEGIFGAGGVPRKVTRTLHKASGGNPFLLVETLKSLVEAGVLTRRPGGGLAVLERPEEWRLPRSVEELLSRRWKSLAPAEARLASALSIPIEPFSEAALFAVSPFPPTLTRSLLALLCARRIVARRGRGTGARIWMAHARLRELARAELRSDDSRRAHSRLARVRKAEGASPDELSACHTAAGENDEAIAMGFEALAGMRRPNDSARIESLCGRLLSVIGPRDPRRHGLLMKQAEARSLRGDHVGAAALLEGAKVRGKEDRHSRARRLLMLSNERVHLHRLDEARAGFEEVVGIGARNPRAREDATRAFLGLTRVEIASGRPDAAMAAARKCLARLRRCPEIGARNAIESAVLCHVASLRAAAGHVDAAIDTYTRSIALLEGHPDSVEKGGLAMNLANAHATRGDHAAAVRWYDQARRIARRIGARGLEALVSANLGLEYLGRWDMPRARDAVRDAIRAGEGLDSERYVAFARLCHGSLLARRGDLDEAISLLEVERRRARAAGDRHLVVSLTYQLAKASLERGDFGASLALARSGRRMALKAAKPRWAREGSLVLGAVWLHLGDPARAARLLEESMRPPPAPKRLLVAEALLHLGVARCRSGQTAKGLDLLGKAAASFRSLRSPLRVAESLQHIAAGLATEGSAAGARRKIDRAWRLVSRVPARERPLPLWAQILAGRAELLLPHTPPGAPLLLDLHRDLTEARELLAERKARRMHWQISRLLAAVHEAMGNRDAARALLDEARTTLQIIHAGLPVTLASSLVRAPGVRAILEGSSASSGRVPVEEHGEADRDRFCKLEEENKRLRVENERLVASLSTRGLRSGVDLVTPAASAPYRTFHGLVGDSCPMRKLYDLIEKVAATDLPVVVRGETGSGKDLVLRAIHSLSRRRDGPFVTESLGAIPEGLIESELFGHTESAFTGATGPRPGRIAAAHRGTLCLTEIDEVPLAVQAKLLIAIESGQVRAVGSSEPQAFDFRLLSSVRSDLRDAAAKGRIREDILHRLLGLELVIPPLRDRREDIPLLVDHFLHSEAERFGHRPKIEAEALERLLAHDWPGNVRELENEVRRLTILGTGRIRATDLSLGAHRQKAWHGSPAPGPVDSGLSWSDAKDALDRAYLEDALRRCRGNVRDAARLLGIHERSIYKLRRRLGRAR
jgi:DNA-binding NtrC family response regulator/tetratricopeptide (TPR) repeat protein